MIGRAVDDQRAFAGLRSILELPVLNERYWLKAKALQVDALMLDLEDSVSPEHKPAARSRILEGIAGSDVFAGKAIIVRVNNLATPWGRDDLEQLATCPGDITICYPKVESAAELDQVASLTRGNDTKRGIYAMIETPRAIVDLAKISRSEALVGLHFGYTDFAAEMGCAAFNEAGDDLSEALRYPRVQIAIAAAARGLFATAGSMIPDYKNLVAVETFLRAWVDVGYNAVLALSPSHLAVVKKVFEPSAQDVDLAMALCRAYDAALADGRANAILDGRVITAANHRQANNVLMRAGAAPFG